MHFVQHYLDCLSPASYLVGDQASGRAVVVDPRRNVQSYLDDAAAAGLGIERVIETHVHADFSQRPPRAGREDRRRRLVRRRACWPRLASTTCPTSSVGTKHGRGSAKRRRSPYDVTAAA